MSLLVWLPLDNHLKNLGLSSSTFNSSNVAYSQGKIGYAASGRISSASADYSSTTGFSFGLWWKIDSGNSYSVSVPVNTGPATNKTLVASKIDYPTSTPAHEAIKLQANGNTPQMIWTRDSRYGTSGKWTLGKWFHYVVTVENGDFGTKVKTYINGVLEQTKTESTYNFTLATGSITLDGTALMNDFRLYDHCLTPKEIEEWSRGLMLHYPLRDSSLQNTTNYVPYPTYKKAYANSTWNATLHPDAIEVTSYYSQGYNGGVGSPATGYHAYWKMVDDEPTMVFQDLNSEYGNKHRWLGISVSSDISNYVTAIGAGKKYTISFEAKSDTVDKVVNVGLYYAKSGTTDRAFHDGTKNFYLTTEWKRYSYTFTLGSSINFDQSSSIYVYGHYGTPEGVAWVRRLQLEANDHATDYTIGQRINTNVEDSSGFQHHGSMIGSLEAYGDSARHEYCIYQGDGRSNYIASKNILFPKDTITMCCWVKGTGAGYSNYHIPMSFNSSAYEMSLQGDTGLFRGGFLVNGSRVCETSGSGTTLDGKWHFLAITYDGSTIRKYVDCVETQALSSSGSLSGGTGQLLVGNYNGTTYGNKNLYTSDVRIYATALTIDALKEIYTIGATIDKGGTLYGYEFIERDANSIFKTGIVDFSKITEYNIDRFKYYDGELWAQILHHNNKSGTVLFTQATADNYTSTDLYSRLYLIEELRGADGSFEFLALQPDDDPSSVYRWKQTNNPNTSTTGTGFVNISNMTGALVKCSGCTLWAISNTTSNWWNAVGCYSAYNGGIPGFGKVVPKGSLDVYVKIDKRSSILKDSIEAYNLYEL